MDFSHCGVGFICSLKNKASHDLLKTGLLGLKNVEHRGGTDNNFLGDGAGIMTSVPHELLGINKDYAVAMIFAPKKEDRFEKAMDVFKMTFKNYGLIVESIREVPVDESVLAADAVGCMPKIIQAFIKRPKHCRTMSSFDELLYTAKQMVRTNGHEVGLIDELYFTSLSSQTIIYKALSTSFQLEKFYLDLQNPAFKTKFALFHRRFSTNTLSSWDKVQPFRVIAHNGEINTIEGNRAAAKSRELALGLREDQVLTRSGASDSVNLNEMVEALKYRSSMPFVKDILAIMIPPAESENSSYFKFWSRAMEPWDGPALIAYCDGKKIGARLDRSGFRPCRWQRTKDYFSLCSETGSFEFSPADIIQQGVLNAGRTVNVHMFKGEVDFYNPDKLDSNAEVFFDSRLKLLPYSSPENDESFYENKMGTFFFTKEELTKELYPIIESGKGPIGSMGDTAALVAFSRIHRSIYDYFFQDFAQVTNPPLDYIREKMVTSLAVYLGRKPNVFSPKELIPPHAAIELETPIISLGQMEYLKKEKQTEVIDICFDRTAGLEGFSDKIQECTDLAAKATMNGKNIIVLSDRQASYERPAIPSIIVMRAVQLKLNALGIRLKISLIVESGEIRNSHQVAVLVSFGASAICPYLALNLARHESKLKTIEHLSKDEKEQRLITGFSEGLMKIMAKRGISVLRSYQGSELFTILGLEKDIMSKLFSKHPAMIGGLTFSNLYDEIIKRTQLSKDGDIPNNFLYKEHASGKLGEAHSLTTKRAMALHKLLKEEFLGAQSQEWTKFKEDLTSFPINIRDFFSFKKQNHIVENLQSSEDILKHFGSGAMSYGSISAEAQRDIFLAMEKIGGRSNSGEGGENPYFYSDGITSKIKQIASGRFGVTARYLTSADEIQIKMAQGAKPGEGGQLMGIKVDEAIAQARYATAGVSLISPPPHHDIYSIEDLKQLIYELKQLKEGVKVSVKLVSGKNIGAIALGVAKAGADNILISGGNGGTGAANLMSMKHAGLPWEIGLIDVHKMLCESGLREQVKLRVDGGLFTGKDLIVASIFGADEFDFGKILLVSQGCIMARVCEKNTCPAGIATQDPKFKKRYKGEVENIVKYLKYLADDVSLHLKELGVSSIKDLVGRTDLLEYDEKHQGIKERLSINLDYFLKELPQMSFKGHVQTEGSKFNPLNKKICDFIKEHKDIELEIKSPDRAIPASLNGLLAMKNDDSQKFSLRFSGSAGQGFGVFNTKYVDITLRGEANDSVAKGMSGGKIVILPSASAQFSGSENVLIGNTALYGATGGEFYLHGCAGDRFGVRNSGAKAVVESVGLHACEYMTGGVVIILGHASKNIGAGMTGGKIYTIKENLININEDFITHAPIKEEDVKEFGKIYKKYLNILKNEGIEYENRLKQIKSRFIKLVPRG